MAQYIFYGAIDRGDENWGPQRAERYVDEIGGELLFYVDQDRKKQGLLGYRGGVRDPLTIKDYPNAIVVVFCSAHDEVVDFLKKNGIQNEILAFPNFGFGFPYTSNEHLKTSREWIIKHEKEVLDIYDRSDELTRNFLQIIVKQRKMPKLSFVPVEEMFGYRYRDYFYDETLVPRQDVTLLDGGAFTGDSIAVVHKFFGNHLKCIYAFEPDPEGFEMLKKNLRNMGLFDISFCIQAGMFDYEGSFAIERAGDNRTSHFTNAGEITVPLHMIDNIVKKVNGKLLIKMDIEGSEIAALRGAKNTIAKYRPYLAICVYHKMEDILEVPKTILSACQDYKFYLRGGTHVECYGVPLR